jgi:pimeloyl-ACP methyl ester carboxylesterase
MKEISEAFGSERHLIGTVTLPSPSGAAGIGFVIVNAGVIHRIGPHRWHVKLARHMAGLGFPSIRFDPAGLGDSRVPRDAVSFKAQAVRDVGDAMDHLQQVAGVREFIVGGICSGAENGFNAALTDPRIVGLWMLDGFAFPTARTRWRRYTLKLRGMSVGQIAAGVLRKLLPPAWRGGAGGPASGLAQAEQKVGASPPAEEFAGKLQAIVDRRVPVYILYSGSIVHLFNYAEQLHDRFAGRPFLRAIEVLYRPDIDHTVTTRACQTELTRLLAQWTKAVAAGRVSTVGMPPAARLGAAP